MKAALRSVFVVVLGAAALAAADEVVVLKGGKVLHLSRPYAIRGSQAIMTLSDGTVISVARGEIDAAATREARKEAQPPAQTPKLAETPVEAARASRGLPKAKVAIGDSDVSHILSSGEEAQQPKGEDDAALTVVNFDQSVKDGEVTVVGTLRNGGKTAAQAVGLNVSGLDANQKVVGSASASVSSTSIDPGATASFTVTIPSGARFASVRFQPHWSTPVRRLSGPSGATGTAPATPPQR